MHISIVSKPSSIFFLALIGVSLASEPGRDDFYYDVFPKGFQWGYSTASYQIEGTHNLDGKGENIWDEFTHRSPSPILDGSTGDVACDSYHLYKEDVAALKAAGANFYRFSLSWSRLLPNGKLPNINKKGLAYYNGLIDELLANGIEPYVTLYHWDLPLSLQTIGGWRNEELAHLFAAYARVAFKNFGDRVKNWITFNEVKIFCKFGLAYGVHAPGIIEPAQGPYQCAHTVIKAHALAYRIYDEEFRAHQQGRVGITLDARWMEPGNRSNAEDVAASHRALKFSHGWIANPLFYGDYPPIMRELIDAKSLAEGRTESRLPRFDPTWTKIIKGTIDFLGLNHYTTIKVTLSDDGPPGHDGDSNVAGIIDPNWPTTVATQLFVLPWGLRRLVNWLAMEYGNPEIIITENGFPQPHTQGVHDVERINYFKLYINELLKAVKIDGVNVKAYTAWSLVDNFEWAEGYTQRFGVHFIDFAGGNLTRVPKDSVKFLRNVFAHNGFPSSAQLKDSAQNDGISI